jgi:hypothetical protein
MDCQDRDRCTADGCDAVSGCVHAPAICGDIDNDQWIGPRDFAAFHACMGGPNVLPNPWPPWTTGQCVLTFDVDTDQDVDLNDAGRFWTLFAGP